MQQPILEPGHPWRAVRAVARPATLASRIARLALTVAVCAFLPVGSAAAAPPLTERFPVEGVFDYEPLSDVCGFPVTLGFEGTFAIKVFSGADGTLREIDTQPATKVTFGSEWGEVSFPFSAVLHTYYPEGAVAGAPAHLVLTGRTFGVDEFVGPGRGRLVLEGVVDHVDDGFPVTRFTELVSASGSFSPDAGRICAALGAP